MMEEEILSAFGKHITTLDDLSPELREIALGGTRRSKQLAGPGVASGVSGNGGGEIAAEAPIDFVEDSYSYEIGGLAYEVREPVLEQERQIAGLIKGAKVETGRITVDLGNVAKSVDSILGNVSPDALLGALGDLAPGFFAIVLTPKCQHVKDKNLTEIEEHLRWEITLSQQIEVVQSFFGLLKGKVKAALAKTVRAKIKSATP